MNPLAEENAIIEWLQTAFMYRASSMGRMQRGLPVSEKDSEIFENATHEFESALDKFEKLPTIQNKDRLRKLLEDAGELIKQSGSDPLFARAARSITDRLQRSSGTGAQVCLRCLKPVK
jgi:cytidylate kinase